jgi:hypothetical protein
MPTALPAMRPASGDSMPVLKARMSSNRAYVLIDRDGIIRWTFAEETTGSRRENAELLEQIRSLR